MSNTDHSQAIQDAVQTALTDKTTLNIQGGNTKQFYGRRIQGRPLDVSVHRGIVSYEPTELVLTARCGTALREIEQALDKHNQMLPFEPPHFGDTATLGGAVASGLSGPRRPYSGAVRDNVLGVKIINGKGQILSFGGEVMKNVAGYDASRLMAGAMGTLGILLEVSIKVLPKPATEITIARSADAAQAIQLMTEWTGQYLPVSATYHDGKELYIRLSGNNKAIESAKRIIGSDSVDWSDMFWYNLREQANSFFMDDLPLWRLSLPAATTPLQLQGDVVMEWDGGLRWLKSSATADNIRSLVNAAGGHAILFRNGDRDSDIFNPLSAGLLNIHKNLKQAFDPQGIFNPQRLYAEF